MQGLELGRLGNNHMLSICSTLSTINFTQIFLYQLINRESCKADSSKSRRWETLLFTPQPFPVSALGRQTANEKAHRSPILWFTYLSSALPPFRCPFSSYNSLVLDIQIFVYSSYQNLSSLSCSRILSLLLIC